MSPPLVALWHTTEYYFLRNTYTFGNDLVYVLVFFLFLCCSWNIRGRGGWGIVICLFAVSFLAAMTVPGCCQMLSMYLWNEWVDGLINTLMAHYFLSHIIPKPHGDSWLMLLPALQNPVIHCHVYGHYLCIPTCSPLPFAFTPGLSQTTLSFLRTDAPLHFPQGGQHRARVITVPTGPVFTVVQMLFTWSWYTSGRFRLRPQPSTLNHMLIRFFWFMHDLWWVNEWMSEWAN